MSRIILKGILCFMLLTSATVVKAQQGHFIVTSVKGKAELIANKHKRPVQKGVRMTEDTPLYIPYNGEVTVIDESTNKEYTFKAIGWAALEDKMKDGQHTVLSRTKDYVKSVVNQLSDNHNVKVQYVSDVATVTREYYVDEELTEVPDDKMDKKNDFRNDFDSFKKKARIEYDDFRKKAFKEYTEFVRQAWKDYGAEPPIEQPEEKEVEPMLVPDADEETASWFSKLFRRKDKSKSQEQVKQPEKKQRQNNKGLSLKYGQVVAYTPNKPQPQPLSEVQEVPEDANTYKSFRIFGTEIKVRIGDNCLFHLSGVSNNEVADALQEFTNPQYDNLLYDCLKMRDQYKMSDWAYYQMLLALTDLFYGKDTNEAALVMGFLYSQSGYMMRYASQDNVLLVLIASEHTIYNTSYIHIDGHNYYIFKGGDRSQFQVCQAKFEKEGSMSLRIAAAQELSMTPAPERTITSYMNNDFSFTISSNKNYMDFFDTYPPSCIGDNFMTRWAMYANTPLEKGIQDQLYPSMKEKLAGLSQKDAVQQLLWWVQTGFKYEYDEKVWGRDRAFFGEESLFYPYCDCEDRSILLSHLVRDLLGLKVVLVYYPGHLALAVHFTDDVEGDHIMLDGRKFVVCDPTYIRSSVGETMPGMSNNEAKVILLD